jgi:hypothetical protein
MRKGESLSSSEGPLVASRPRNVINVHAYAGRGSMMVVAADMVRGLQGPEL